MTELEDLRTHCRAADAQLGAALDDLRAALAALETIGETAARIQREARDVEFEPVPPRVRAHLDGSLLQRTGFVNTRAADAAKKIRELAQGLRDLRADCAALVTLEAD